MLLPVVPQTNKKNNIQAAPIRQYLEGTVVPVLMQGMQV